MTIIAIIATTIVLACAVTTVCMLILALCEMFLGE